MYNYIIYAWYFVTVCIFLVTDVGYLIYPNTSLDLRCPQGTTVLTTNVTFGQWPPDTYDMDCFIENQKILGIINYPCRGNKKCTVKLTSYLRCCFGGHYYSFSVHFECLNKDHIYTMCQDAPSYECSDRDGAWKITKEHKNLTVLSPEYPKQNGQLCSCSLQFLPLDGAALHLSITSCIMKNTKMKLYLYYYKEDRFYVLCNSTVTYRGVLDLPRDAVLGFSGQAGKYEGFILQVQVLDIQGLFVMFSRICSKQT